MKKRLIAFSAAALIAIFQMQAIAADAADRLFERDYLYRASEADSKLSCRAIALEQVKRLLLEELGTYLVSETVVRDAGLTKDEVTTITAGIVRSDIKEERWNGETYYIRVEIAADPNAVAEAVNEIAKERQGLEELKESKARADAAMLELDRLRAELADAKLALAESGKVRAAQPEASAVPSATPPPSQTHDGQQPRQVAEIEAAYRSEVASIEAESLWNQGHALFKKNRCDEAIALFDRAIEIEPMMARAYANRATCMLKLKRFEQALADYDVAIGMDQKRGKWYFGRSRALDKLKRRKEARKDLERAANMGNPEARKILRREH